MQGVKVLVIIFIFSMMNLANLAHGGSTNIFNVTDFGAIGDGESNNSQAFLNAWKALCEAGEDGNGRIPVLQIPNGTFLLNPVQFHGPCKSKHVHIQLWGKLLAPITIKSKWWILFNQVRGLIIDGSGSLDGQGSHWWKKTGRNRLKKPRALQFHRCDDLLLNGVTQMNSPNVHMGLNYCNGVTISNITITAPELSPNTDGIDISYSSNVNISNSNIGTGDDCIAINGGCSNINVNNVTCGPGHGISVGSLGDQGVPDMVEDVHVENCTFIGAQNGARIKTCPGGSGFARKITFKDIILKETKNPIIIDQYYCNGRKCKAEQLASESAVKISEIWYIGVEGTSESIQGITLNCAKLGCTNIRMERINITSSKPGKEIQAYCNHVHGTSANAIPFVSCLSE